MNMHHADEWADEIPTAPSTGALAIDMTDVDALYKMAEAGRVLRSVTAMLEKLLHLASGANDLTLMHCLVLLHLSRAASCRQADVKAATGAAAPHLTKLLDELVQRDLVSRHRSSTDRRHIILALTAAGRETACRQLAALHGVIDKAQISAIEQLGSTLERFVSRAERDGKLDQGSEKD